ncbi:synaptotagmin-like protein 3 isoform X1 [Denticeps clupeoides]|uniref:synaptotagmin-like protein 3 isoform X1 n=1 Tax=Denticeps clupeoides TaxID=299321 RepID=UPI0010A38C6E|nr:synaptotagmin-like protein 3 isoform X1 [Denticeps clupeoides]
MDLSLLKALEREKVLEVLHRDKILRSMEEDRIRRLKVELQDLRRRGAKSISRQYGERTCARCQKPLGRFWNTGAVCLGCSHRICGRCRVFLTRRFWRCTVCHAYREVKVKSGEWFLEERGKKFPHETAQHETIGEKLLKSHQRLGNISIVPPTPPPFQDVAKLSFSRSGNFTSSPLTKSMEDLVMSFNSHIRRISKSQSDLRADLLTVNYDRTISMSKSQSDTAISTAFILNKGPSLSNIFKKFKEWEQQTSKSLSSGALTDRDTSLSSGETRLLHHTAHLMHQRSGPDSRGEKLRNNETELKCSFLSQGSNSSIETDADSSGNPSVTGEIEIALAYSFNTSCLEILISACKNIMFGGFKQRKCHPYVKVYLLPDKSSGSKLKTTTKKNTTDPVFKETLQYSVERHLLASRTLHVSVWHSETLKRKFFIGEVLIPLEGWRFEDSSTKSPAWYPLQPKSDGGAVDQVVGLLLVKVKFSNPKHTSDSCSVSHEAGQLTVLVTGVQNMTGSKSGAAFVKGSLTLPGGQILSQRSPVVKKKSNLKWALQLVFSKVTLHELKESVLHLDLWDQATFSLSERLLGTARLQGAPSWQALQQMPSVWHSFSLALCTSINTRKP